MICEYCGHDDSLLCLGTVGLSLQEEWPSQNVIAKNTRGYGGRSYRVFRKKYEAALPSREPVDEFAYVFLTRCYGKRKRQYDVANLIGGGKPLVDALVLNGHLVDDSPKWMRAWYYQEKSTTGENHIKITINYVRKSDD